MTEGFELDGPRFGPARGGRPDALIVLAHGLGADGNDLIGLAPQLGQVLPGAAFASPHAPFPCDMAPFGRQWFSLQDRSPDAILAGVRAAAPILDGFVDAELARHELDDDRLVLIGFSQGTMMSLYIALRRAEACAGVLGYSGALIGAEHLAAEITSKPPVLLIHGEADEIVPVQALPHAVAALEACGVPVTGERRPHLGHGIDPEGLTLGARFLTERLGG
ncbi:MAG: dienelactone hydrolase family protein [Rhodospirillales bacterium]|nr:dienelactone hydrolase family protein [Rhodospirillales bacterium]